jgi:hypothetical protein
MGTSVYQLPWSVFSLALGTAALPALSHLWAQSRKSEFKSTLITALQERTTPLAAERWTTRRSASLTPFERAAIETLEVAVLVPFRRGPDLVAFSCLGPKRSGDIYTPTDLAWLGARTCMLGFGRSYPQAYAQSDGRGACGPLWSQARKAGWGSDRSTTGPRKLVDNSSGGAARDFVFEIH